MRISLNIKFALATTALFLLCAVGAAWHTSAKIEELLLHYIELDHSSQAEHIAANLDRQLLLHRQALINKSSHVGRWHVQDPRAAHALLHESAALKTLFPGGVYLFAPDGTLVAESPFEPGRTMQNYAFRDYFRDTLRRGESVISSPFMSLDGRSRPLIIITAPVFAKNGDLTAMLGGAIDLKADSLFSIISDTKLPNRGYFSLLADDGTVITHGDASQIMTKMDASLFAALSANASADKSVTISRKNHLGMEVISTVRRLQSTGWILTVNSEKDAVYEPVHRTRQAFLAVVAIGSPLMVFLLIALSYILTAPLRSMTRQVRRIQDAADDSQRVSISSRDEVTDLAAATNAMLNTIAESQRLIREKEQLFLTWFGRSKDAIVLLNERWQVLDLNEAGRLQFGMPKHDSLGFADMVPDSFHAIQKAMSMQGYLKDLELQVHHGDGSSSITIFSCEIVQEQDAIPLKYMGIFRDITDKVKLTQQLQHAQKMEAVGRIAGGVAHDFNNLLCAMVGFCSLAKMKIADNDPAWAYLTKIEALTDRGASLTKNLLLFSRRQPPVVRPISVNQTLGTLSGFLHRVIGEDIRLEIHLADTDIAVSADAGQIEQVLMNLATNARDAMPGGGRLTISVSPFHIDHDFIRAHGYGESGMYAALSVEDTGAGMDDKTREKIFEPFFTTKETGKGTGLGMAIAYGIVKQHRGFINVYSEVGKGTTFRILLPAAAQQEARSTEAADIPYERGTEWILLAEDDATLREVMRTVLTEHGYYVIEAADGRQAVDIFEQNRDRIHLVLIDVIMPEMSGREASDKIRKMKPDVKVLFISGYTADHLSAKGILEEEMHYVSKPISPRKLLRKIREVLSA